MNVETFMENFGNLTESPGGVQKMRDMVLQLAIQGKLVSRDPDAKASELLEEMAALRTKLIAEKVVRKSKPQPPIDQNSFPFDMPPSWEPAYLDTVCSLVTDGEHQTPVREVGGAVPMATAKNVRDGHIDLSNTDTVAHDTASLCWKRCLPSHNDILMVCVGATTGRLCVLREPPPFVIVRSVALFRPFSDCVLPDYLAICLRSPFGQSQVWGGVKQSAQPCLYISKSKAIKIPLPPFDEQQRIVAKVDELMALCDELESQQQQRRAVHVRASEAALDQLTTAANPTDFNTAWSRIRDQFDLLYSTPETVAQLRAGVLGLAVQGKLVSQNPHDQPAKILAQEILEQKKKLEDSGEIKKQPKSLPIQDDETLFSIPENWTWVRAADLSYPISSGSTPAKSVFQNESSGGIPYLKVYNIREQKINFEYKPQYICETHHAAKMKRSILVPGMVVLNIVGPPLGKTAVIPDTHPEWNCNQAIAFFRLIGGVLPECLHLFFREGSFLRNIALIGTAGQDNISVTKCKNIVVPLPPVAEQRRIIERTQQLMALCDELEAKLTQQQTDADRLTEAMVAAILEGAAA